MSGRDRDPSASYGTRWPDQVRADGTVVPPRQESYVFGNPNLPIAAYRDLIADTIGNNEVTVLGSNTGTGKSTMVPQILYETGSYRNIHLTQPRIVAGRELGGYITKQMSEAVGSDMSSVVGYRTSTEGNLQPSNRIRLYTDGYLFSQMIHLVDQGTITKDDIVGIDEAHERNLQIDSVMAFADEHNLRLFIMSATINRMKFAKHCSEVRGGIDVPIIDVPGRTFEVQEVAGGNFADEIVNYANKRVDGKPLNIQAFIPGEREANATIGRIMNRIPSGYTILKLNGDQTIEEQRRCFENYPNGKIVFSTNVGRTSLTIADNDVAIDSMWERIGDFNLGERALRIRPVSQASVEQARGRVGRTKPGIYVQTQLETYPPIPKISGKYMLERYDIPGILKSDLTSQELKLSSAGYSIDTLPYLDPPRSHEVDYARQKLVKLGARGLESARLNEIGEQMAKLPLDAHYARMMVESRNYSTDVQMQMAAMLSASEVQGITMTEKDAEAWRSLTNENRSDMLVQLDVFIQSLGMSEMEMSHYNIIDQRRLKAMKKFERLCRDLNLNPEQINLPNEGERQALLGCIVTGNDGLFVSRGYEQYGDERGVMRRLSRSTSVMQNEGLVVGTAFTLQHMRGVLKSHSLITNATAVTPAMLEKHTPWRCDYLNDRQVLDANGNVVIESDLYYDGLPTRKKSYRKNMQPTAETKELLIDKLFHDRPKFKEMSEATQAVYGELDRLERYLVHWSDNHSEHEHVIHMLTESAQAVGSIPANNINSLVTVLEKRGMLKHLQNTLPEDSKEAREIVSKTPSIIAFEVGDQIVEAPVSYLNNEAYITVNPHYVRHIGDISEAVYGRNVYVRTNDSQKYLQLNEAIARYGQERRSVRRGNDDGKTTQPMNIANPRNYPQDIGPATANRKSQNFPKRLPRRS
jgi:HrpA-like RNA helicase